MGCCTTNRIGNKDLRILVVCVDRPHWPQVFWVVCVRRPHWPRVFWIAHLQSKPQQRMFVFCFFRCGQPKRHPARSLHTRPLISLSLTLLLSSNPSRHSGRDLGMCSLCNLIGPYPRSPDPSTYIQHDTRFAGLTRIRKYH
jgi:hypothetical protein